MLALVILISVILIISGVLFTTLLKYAGILVAAVAIIAFYLMGYAAAIFASIFWFFGVWYFGQSAVLVISGVSCAIFLLTLFLMAKYIHGKIACWKIYKTIKRKITFQGESYEIVK